MGRVVPLAHAAALLIGCGGSAAAQEAAPNSAWRFQITPYVWAAGFGGDITLGRRAPTIRVDESFGEILSDLDFGLFVGGVAIRDRLVLSADLSYIATSRGGELLAAPPVAARGSLEQFSTTLLGGWRAVTQPGFDLDVLAGLRAWSIDAEVEVRVAGTPFVTQSRTIGWVDPVLAFRARADFAPRLSVLVLGDMGGFGAGSRFTWQAAGLLNYQLTPDLFASAGYRHLAADYRDGGRRLDFSLSGPVFGLTLRF